MKTQFGKRIGYSAHNVSFGFTDTKGRVIGYTMETWEVDVTEAPPEIVGTYWNYCGLEPGHYYACCPQATRDASKYGALQPEKFYRTSNERIAYIDRYDMTRHKEAKKKSAGVMLAA